MHNASLWLMVLLCILVQGQDSNVTEEWKEPSLPRLCGLSLNDTTFTCRYQAYGTEVALRSILAIVLSAAAFLILTVGLCCCCWKTSLKDQIKLKDGTSTTCHTVVKIILMLIPVAAFIVGCLLVLTAHYNLDPTFRSTVTELNYQYAAVEDILRTVNSSIPNGIDPSVPQAIIGGVRQLQSNILLFKQVTDGFDIGRTVVVWFACALAVMTAVLSCIYVQRNKKSSIFEWYCAFAIILILGSCITIIVLQVVNVVGTDTCNEVYYKMGAVQLFQSDLTGVINSLLPQFDSSIASETRNLCDNAANMCYRGPTGCCNMMCAPCNSSSALSFQNKTIIDNSKPVIVRDCAWNCSDQGLKGYSGEILKSSLTINELRFFAEKMSHLLDPFTDYEFIVRLRILLCNLSGPINLIWVGCAFFLLACLISSILCVLLRGARESSKN